MATHRAAVDRLLAHLHLDREPASLDYLHRIVRAHQRRVPFETFTKLLDYEPGLERGDFMPPFELYVERIVTRGAGGLCWTLARGLHVLLHDLGFDASLMVMAPGHCCVRVDVPEGPFYADVGYAAPIFRAYPLFESFSLETHRETFDYRVGEEGILVTRNPGPTKALDPTPRRLEDLHGLIDAANDWSDPQSFLRRMAFAAYVEGTFTSLRDGVLTRSLPDGAQRSEVAPAAIPDVLAGVFKADPRLHHEALEVRRRHGPGTEAIRTGG